MAFARPTLGLRWYFEHNDGRLIDKWDHYFEVYERYLRRYRGTAPRMLEIGVSHGGSLEMWRHYFGRRSKIVGIDIEPRTAALAGPGVTIEIGNQSDPDFLARICAEYGPFDIVLDDGGHWFDDQRTSLSEIWPHVRDRGLYMVEDVHTSYLASYGGGVGVPGTFIDEVRERIDDMHRFWLDGESAPNEWTSTLGGIHVHDSIVVFDKTRRDRPVREMTGRPAFDTIYRFPADDMITAEHRAQLARLNSPTARVRRAIRDPRGTAGRVVARVRAPSRSSGSQAE